MMLNIYFLIFDIDSDAGGDIDDKIYKYQGW